MPMYGRHRNTGKHSHAPKNEGNRKRDRSRWKRDTSASSNTNCSDGDCDDCVPSVVPFHISSESDCYPLSDYLSTDESRHECNHTVVKYNKCRGGNCQIRNDSSSSCESRSKYRTRKKEVCNRRHQNIKPPIAPKPNFHIYVSEKKPKRNQMISPSKSDESIFAQKRNGHPDVEVIRIPSSPRSYEKRGAKPRRRTCSGERISFDEEWLRPKINDSFAHPAHSTEKNPPKCTFDDHNYRHFREVLSSSSSSSEKECARFQCSQRTRHGKEVKHETFNNRSRGNYKHDMPHDDDQMFLLSILPTMKKLSDSNKMSAKVKILSTLQKAAECSSPPSYTPHMFAQTSSRPMSPTSDGFCSLKNIREAYRELCVSLKNSR